MLKRMAVLAFMLSLLAVGSSSSGHSGNRHFVYGVGSASVVWSSNPPGTYHESQGILAVVFNNNDGTVVVTGRDPFLTPIPYNLDCLITRITKSGYHTLYFRTAPVLGIRWRGALQMRPSGRAWAYVGMSRPGETGTGECGYATEAAAYVKVSHGWSRTHSITLHRARS